MKRKFYVPLLILLPLPMAITIPFMVTSCSSNDIKMQITDETRYDSIIQPAPAQTVTTEQELLELSRVYLNNPNRVAKDWTIAQGMDAEAILYHGRTGGIFSAPMNVYNPSNGNYEPQSPSSIQPATAVDFFNDYGYTRTQTTDFTNAVIDPDAPNPYGIAPTNGMYYNGLRNEVNWKYGQASPGGEANCVVKCFGSEWDGDEDFYGYGHYDPIQKFDVIPNLEKKENQWLYVEKDSSLDPSVSLSPLNDGCWISGAYYFDNLTINIPSPNKQA